MKHVIKVQEKFKPTYKDAEIDLPMYLKWISKDKKTEMYIKIYKEGDQIIELTASFYKPKAAIKDRLWSDFISIGKRIFFNHYTEEQLRRIKRDEKANKALFEKKFKQATLLLTKE